MNDIYKNCQTIGWHTEVRSLTLVEVKGSKPAECPGLNGALIVLLAQLVGGTFIFVVFCFVFCIGCVKRLCEAAAMGGPIIPPMRV